MIKDPGATFTAFSDMVSTSGNRAKFIKSLIAFMDVRSLLAMIPLHIIADNFSRNTASLGMLCVAHRSSCVNTTPGQTLIGSTHPSQSAVEKQLISRISLNC